ncbi:hypothetical protein FTUN_2696 [Frigoriglobus tundricola]|uniref:Uncharacterized protein n=1 Tax=Frigoriglobus tundricola TaxID=2774151 RepID=A0A6M5YM82_9BACT|nr:hypothetical protein FTUN_2696 [Frigoriglobus tundricola]
MAKSPVQECRMSSPVRLQMEALEAREVPAAFSAYYFGKEVAQN